MREREREREKERSRTKEKFRINRFRTHSPDNNSDAKVCTKYATISRDGRLHFVWYECETGKNSVKDPSQGRRWLVLPIAAAAAVALFVSIRPNLKHQIRYSLSVCYVQPNLRFFY